MKADTFDPASAGVQITPPARAHLAGQLQKTGRRFLRLGVSESGCNGFMYQLDYIDRPDSDDRPFDAGDVRVYVREVDLPLVIGTQIDFVIEGLNASLRFKNPNAASYCGCGESFSVKPAVAD